MGDHGLDEAPAEVWNHVIVVAARGRRHLQLYREEHQQDDCHAESGNIADKDGDREQDLVESLADIGGKGAKDISD